MSDIGGVIVRKKYWCRVYNTETKEIYCIMMWKLPHLTKHQYHMIIAEMFETAATEGITCMHITADLAYCDTLEEFLDISYGYETQFDYRFIARFWGSTIVNGSDIKWKLFCKYHQLRTMTIAS